MQEISESDVGYRRFIAFLTKVTDRPELNITIISLKMLIFQA